MGRGDALPLRALPRFFLPGAKGPVIELPAEEWKKVHNVLRLSSGEEIAILPDDGTVLRCVLEGHAAKVLATFSPNTESQIKLTLALGLPRPEKLEESVRMASEMGVTGIVVFPAARSVVKWDHAKQGQKMDRLKIIAREACEVAYRTRLPEITWCAGLSNVLQSKDPVYVMSEFDNVTSTLPKLVGQATLVIGPEGGWAPSEVALIGSKAVTLGPRVFRVDTAVAAACALALLS